MSKVSVSMKMSPKQAGALYMKCMKLEDELKQLESERDELSATVERLRRIVTGGLSNKRGSALDVLNEIDDTLQATPRQNLAKIEAVRGFIDWLAAEFKRGDDVWSMSERYIEQLKDYGDE